MHDSLYLTSVVLKGGTRMKSQLQAIGVTALLLGAVVAVGAQTADQSTHKSAIINAMSKVADNSGKSCDGVDCVIGQCQDAAKSGDVKKMRAALDMAQQQLKDVKSKSRHASKLAMLVHDHMEKVDDQRAKVKAEQQKLDALEYPTDEFVIAE